MDHDSNENPEAPDPLETPGSQPDLPPQQAGGDVDPATTTAEDDEEARLPEVPDETNEPVAEGPLALGHAAIERAVRLAPTSPGVYRMLNAANDVLYVGKAKNIRNRLASYARVSAVQPARILRMIAATVTVEIISTPTETEALLLEANLIKQLRPRFNVQLRDDKSFPYILLTGIIGRRKYSSIVVRKRGPDNISDHSLRQARSIERSRRYSAPSWCAPAPIPFLKAARALACSIRSAVVLGPVPAKSIFPAMRSLCVRPRISSRAAAE